MNEKEIMDILERCGAITKGHFEFASGEHGDVYVNKDAVYLHTEELEKLAEEIASKFENKGIHSVAGPAVGGAILANRVAYHLTRMSGHEVFSAYADKDRGKFIIRRGYDKFIDGKKVLIVEDIINTGESAAKTAAAIEKARGIIFAVAALFNRGEMTSIDDIPIKALVNQKLESWKKKDCPLCKKRVPISTDLGHGGK